MNDAAVVISLGGSVVAPKNVDVRFVSRFRAFIRLLSRTRRIAITCGGGAPARSMIASARSLGVTKEEDLHWIGIRQTAMNAELLRAALYISDPVATSYTTTTRFSQRIIIAAGRKPGATTDYCAVILARALGSKTVYNVTDVDGVYTSDPRKNRRAKRFTSLTWGEYLKLFSPQSKPGLHAPFDPVASKAAARYHIRVFIIPSSIGNFRRLLAGKAFRGTLLGPS